MNPQCVSPPVRPQPGPGPCNTVALAVNDASRGAGRSIGLFPALLIEFEMDVVQRSVILPALEIAVQRASRRQVLGDVSPLASGAQDIHDAVEDLPHVDLASPAATLGGWDHPLDQGPLVVGQITRVTQLVPVVPLPVLGIPHEAPRESMPGSES